MLILTRWPGQTFVIGGSGGNVTIKILHQGRSGRTRIGIEAPPGTSILRGELLEPRCTCGAPPPSIHEPTCELMNQGGAR